MTTGMDRSAAEAELGQYLGTRKASVWSSLLVLVFGALFLLVFAALVSTVPAVARGVMNDPSSGVAWFGLAAVVVLLAVLGFGAYACLRSGWRNIAARHDFHEHGIRFRRGLHGHDGPVRYDRIHSLELAATRFTVLHVVPVGHKYILAGRMRDERPSRTNSIWIEWSTHGPDPLADRVRQAMSDRPA